MKVRNRAIAAFVGVLGFFGPLIAQTQPVRHDCDCKVALSMNKDSSDNKLIGHVLKLKVGGTEVACNTECRNPITKQATKVAGVLEQVIWAGRNNDPLQLRMWIDGSSSDMWKKLAMGGKAGPGPNGAHEVELNMQVCQYDMQARSYFQAFELPAGSKAWLLARGGITLGQGKDKGLVELSIIFQPPTGGTQVDIKMATAGRPASTQKWGLK